MAHRSRTFGIRSGIVSMVLFTVVVLIEDGQATLPANVGTQTFVPNDPVPSFTIPLRNEPEPLAFSANAGLVAGGKGASDYFPLLILSADSSDAFVNFMVSSLDSVNDFLAAGPSGCHFLFSAKTAEKASAIADLIEGAVKSANAKTQNEWKGYLHFTNDSASVSLGSELNTILQQWMSPRNAIVFGDSGQFNVSRLDCKYTACQWPGQTDQFRLSLAVGNPCGTIAPAPANSFLLVQLKVGANCTAEIAAANAEKVGAVGVVVAQMPGSMVSPLGVDGNSQLSKVDTMVSAADGAALAHAIATSIHKTNEGVSYINASFASPPTTGQMMAVDNWGFIQEVGWEKYDTLQMLTWEAQWLSYRTKLTSELRAPAFTIPVFEGAVMTSVASITMPPRAMVQQFNSMQLDFALKCAGNRDQDCSVWDRIIDLTVDCGEGEVELGRWINAFQRRVGRWLTSIPLLPILYPMGGGGVCNFTTGAGMGDHWLADLSLRFRNAIENSVVDTFGQPTIGSLLIYPNNGQGFNGPQYNANRTINFTVPAGTTRVAVAAFITGHGGCEFQPTSHHWVVNENKGPDFNTTDPLYFDRFMEAGTSFGCANKTNRGAVPNEHGTWYFGRNGWCDGQDVKPVIFDITSETTLLDATATNTLRYYALSYPVGQPGSPDQKGCGGTMDMSSYLLFYK